MSALPFAVDFARRQTWGHSVAPARPHRPWLRVLAVAMVCAGLLGCRNGSASPLELAQDMDTQPRYRAQSESRLFADGRSARAPVPHTVSQTAESSPSALADHADAGVLARGRERYAIACALCHGTDGEGHGIIVERGFPMAPRLASERVRRLPNAQIFEAITHGFGRMPAHGGRTAPDDRWAIVHHIRTLAPPILDGGQ